MAIILAGELLKKSENLLVMGLHPDEVRTRGYRFACAKALGELKIIRFFLLSLQKPTIEELLDEDARCDTLVHLRPISPSIQCPLSCGTSSLHIALISSPIRLLLPSAFVPPAVFSYLTAHNILTRIVFMLLSFSPPLS
ncbi:hypothetical protein DFJ58DRAFT_748302 [Suillus subalutaceus]|uniref:uncharacterized protein n=1 Tax=Suillus subalutaceus TaxID=48586 RepID=UPI001B87D7A6|nr:uncharacterized protein DFJ58DRAFT_748302 [Suillus subalutaceus]KAG1842047.1 hypothetical protein DFJ58DRAFT_748302 [Suillus subalutaceus]